MESERISWNEYFKELTLITSKRSVCPKLAVGCILVKDNRIVAQGYNGYLPNCPHIPVIKDNHNIGTIHAEQNAICDCAKRGSSCKDSIAFITHYPCYNCFKLLLASGIKEIKYINDYNNDEEVNKLSEIMKIPLKKI